MSDDILKTVGKEAAATGAGVGVPMGAVALAGEAGVSAVGLTTGLAALGFGSMFCGVGVVALIGIITYNGVKAAFEDKGE